MKSVVLGVGRMGRRHIEVIRRAGGEVVGVYDVARAALATAQQECGLSDAQLFDDVDLLLATHRPELVIVAATADVHMSLTTKAAEAGARFVLVEKPMATSLADCDAMIDVCRRHGTHLAVNHQMRFMEQYTRPHALFAESGFGPMSSMTVVSGNFGLAMNGSHYFEAFRYMADDAVATVQAWFSADAVPNPRGERFEDRAGSVRLESRAGRRFYLECGSDQGHGVRATYAGRFGMITINELTGEMVVTRRQDEFLTLPTTRYGMPAHESRSVIAPAEVIDTSVEVLKGLLAGGDVVTGEDGRRVVEILVAAYVSAEAGRAVSLDEPLPRARVFPWA